MKKYIYASLIALMTSLSFTACEEEEGTAPGSDSNAVVTIYQYEAAMPYNSDNDTKLRFVANQKADKVYYIAEKSADVQSFIAQQGEDAYISHVVEKGTSITLTDDNSFDTYVTDLFGPYTISAVAVNGGNRSLASVDFIGLEWSDVATGTYHFANKYVVELLGESAPTTLQQCTTNETLYRFKDVYGEGFNLKFTTLPDTQDEDEDGVFQKMRVAAQNTGLELGANGAIGVRDIGYWQGSDAWVLENGYHGAYYLDGSYAYLYVQYYVTAGNAGYGYDKFEASEVYLK